MSTALITGISGQDGCYLARFLIQRGYKVIGTTRQIKKAHLERFRFLGIDRQVVLVEEDLLKLDRIIGLLQSHQPNEIYNFSAQSSVASSFQTPRETLHNNFISTSNLLEAVRLFGSNTKFYQASSSEMIGNISEAQLPITEQTLLQPASPYAVSKAAAHWLAVNYRESYKLFIVCGILFNHASALRSFEFVTKKIINTALDIQAGKQVKLSLGNTSVVRDWGYAPKYVEAMWLMMQQSKPDDYIIASGEGHSIDEFARLVFKKLKLDFDKNVVIDKRLFRPNELVKIYGSNEKTRDRLGWNYSMSFTQLIDQLIEDEKQLRAFQTTSS